MTPTFAAEEPVPTEEVDTPAEEVSTSVEETTTPEETAVEAETNVDYLNYLEMEDFIISAERIPTNKWDTPANVTVITSQEIEDNHYQSVGEALSHVNSVITNPLQMTGGNRLLYLVDGRRTDIYPSMKMIERIEIVKGGNSALYGSDAFNGVINVITKKGTKNETSIDLNTGTWRQHNYEITNQGVAGKFNWIVTGNLNKSHAYEYKGGLAEYIWKTSTSEYSRKGLGIRLDQRFNERNSLTLDFFHYSNRSRQYSTRDHYYLDQPTQREVMNDIWLTYNFKENMSTPGWLRYVNNYYTYADIGTENPNQRFQSIEYQNGWELGQHKIIAGLEWSKLKDKDVLRNYDRTITTKSIYLQDTISLGDKWTLIPGVRYDYSKEYSGNWSPKIAANYRPDEKTKFYASWGRSYQIPSIAMLYADVPDDDENFLRIWEEDAVFVFGNRNLRPEKGRSTIIGIEHDFDEKSVMTASFFENKIENSLAWALDEDYNDYHYRYYLITPFNAMPLKSRGFELTYRQKIDDHFSYNLGYSHTHSHYESPTAGNITNYLPQPNGYRLGLSYQNRGLKINLHGIMASGINTNITTRWGGNTLRQAYPVRKYAVLDFNLSYSSNDNTTFYFKALNLTNQHYSNSESREFNNDGWKYVYPENGRSFIYGMNYKF